MSGGKVLRGLGGILGVIEMRAFTVTSKMIETTETQIYNRKS